MDNFQQVQCGTQASIVTQISSANAALAAKNRRIIAHIAGCMKHCVLRGHATRGHRDDGMPADNEDEDFIDLGNFKSLVLFKAEDIPELKEHLSKSSTYAMYVSKFSQNDFLSSICTLVQSKVIDEARDQTGKFIFAVSADEVSDVSNVEQLAVVIRTINSKGVIHERLLEYVALKSMTGKSVSDAIIECLMRHGLDVADCRAQTYDGAGNMSGKNNGCQSHIKRLQPLANYFHCASHTLNLALNSTCDVQEFKVMMADVKALGIFFKYSPARTAVLKSVIESSNLDTRVTKVSLIILS